MSSAYDVIVIGAGHNGLTTAAFLARGGQRVLVVEGRDQVGGLAGGKEFAPGYRSPGLLHDTSAVSQEICDALNLEKYGLRFTNEQRMLFADKKGGGIAFGHGLEGEIEKYSRKDADQFRAYRQFFSRVGRVVRNVVDDPPPDLLLSNWRNAVQMARTAISLRLLGKKDMTELLRILPMCTADWLNDWFETDLLKAGLSAPAVYGSFTGPWSPGTNANLVMAETLSGPSVAGGSPALVDALERACKDLGVEIRTRAKVRQVLLDKDRAIGVLLDEGEEIRSEKVAASCDPKTTFQKLVPNHYLTHLLDHRIDIYRSRGTTAKVHYALKSPPQWKGRGSEHFDVVRTGQSCDEVERSFDAVKYGEFSDIPTLDLMVTRDGPSAPQGHAVVSALVNFAPYDLKAGWSEETKGRLLDRVTARISSFCSEFEQKVVAHEVLTPLDLENEYGLTQGHVFHGEHALDQMLSRPTPETARYRTPVPGLFLCGSGNHPGGGITCRPGGLASRVILRS